MSIADETVWLPWRVGRKVGRTVYAVVRQDEQPSDDDTLLGLMDTPRLAARVVYAHNEARDREPRSYPAAIAQAEPSAPETTRAKPPSEDEPSA